MLRLTEGLNGSEEQRKLVGNEGRAAEMGGASGESRRRGAPGFWSQRVDSWRSCEGPTGIREVQESPAARNCKGGAG
jgi:hypothetical protein